MFRMVRNLKSLGADADRYLCNRVLPYSKRFFFTIALVLHLLFPLAGCGTGGNHPDTETSTSVSTFLKTFGEEKNDTGLMVRPSPDGGYLVLGTSWSQGTQGGEPPNTTIMHDMVWLSKMDSDGNEVWFKNCDGSKFNKNILESLSDGYILAESGSEENKAYGNKQVKPCRLRKMDLDGNELWVKELADKVVSTILEIDDGGFIVVGARIEGVQLLPALIVAQFIPIISQFDSLGNELWTHSLDWDFVFDFRSMVAMEDGGFLLIGNRFDPLNEADSQFPEAFLHRTDRLGHELWHRRLSGVKVEGRVALTTTADGGAVLVGSTVDDADGQQDFALVKVDEAGNTLWSKTFGGPGNESAKSIWKTLDGGFAVVGDTDSFGAGETDIFLVRTDSRGNELWSRTLGGKGHDKAVSVLGTSDGGLLLGGTTESFGAGNTDAVLIKTDSTGDVAPIALGFHEFSAAEKSPVKIELAGYFMDLSGETLTYTAHSLPPGMSLDSSLGLLSGTPPSVSTDSGYPFSIEAVDPSGLGATQIFTLQVRAVD